LTPAAGDACAVPVIECLGAAHCLDRESLAVILVSNAAAVLPGAFGGMLGFLVAQSTSPTAGILAGAAAALAVDVGQRFVKGGGGPLPLLNTQAGGTCISSRGRTGRAPGA
jgi:hypothetical protein